MRLRRLVRRLTWQRRLDPALVAAVKTSGLFDPRWYLNRYPDVRAFPLGPLAHFCEHGVRERADPGPRFSTATYLARAPEAGRSGEPPFLHAMARGRDEAYLWTPSTVEALRPAILASGLFDPAYYLEHNPDVARTTKRPFEHYIRFGRVEDRAPGPDFDPEYYADRYPDYRALFPNTIEHFVLYGRARGRVGTGAPLYRRWIDLHDALTPDDEAAIRAEADDDPLPPVQVLHFVDADTMAALPTILDALRGQIGSGWRACFVPSAATPAGARQVVESAVGDDPALRWATSLQTALAGLPDDALLLVAAGGALLRPHAACAFARWLRAHGAEAAYCDHDHLRDGERTAPVFKPEMSPEYLRRSSYAGPVAALAPSARTALSAACAANPVAAELASAVLRRLDPASVTRVPLVLYHVASVGARHLRVPADPPPVPVPGQAPPSVGIVIPTRDRVELLRPCIESLLARTDYPAERREFIVVDNDSREADTAAYFRDIAARGVRIVPAPGSFNFSAINNVGVAASSADIVVFLNNDTTVNRSDWLDRLVAQARKPEIGAVGPRLLYPDGTVQHAGVVLGVHGVGMHRHVGVPEGAIDASDVTREVSAVTGACLAMRRELFLALGGFDASLEVNFNDTKLCAQAVAAGYRNLYLAEPLFHHHESKSRGYNDSPAKQRRLNREAATLIAQFPDLFRDDPAYNPNLSLIRLDEPAFPPRIVRPWRRSRGPRRVLLLSVVHGQGFGVPVVLERQADALRQRGCEVVVGGPVSGRDTLYPGCRRVELADARAAANFAVSEGVDCIVAHTQPFFSVARLVGAHPITYVVDHGQPNAELFPDREAREAVDREKRISASYAKRVFAISRTIYGQQYRSDAIVARNGSTHLSTWSADWAARRDGLRAQHGLADRFVVLDVCRFTAEERNYKGVDRYVEVAQEFGLLHPELKQDVVFLLVGRGEPEDVALLEGEGLRVLANVSDETMREVYAAADLYANFSRWEGYNLGIGQALAMGLSVVASDIEAHREFPIVTSNSLIETCAAIAHGHAAWASGRAERRVVVEPWEPSLDLLCDAIEADCAAAPGPWG